LARKQLLFGCKNGVSFNDWGCNQTNLEACTGLSKTVWQFFQQMFGCEPFEIRIEPMYLAGGIHVPSFPRGRQLTDIPLGVESRNRIFAMTTKEREIDSSFCHLVISNLQQSSDIHL
jgi:hypothetical protein